jgi:hypothetical protein
MIYIIVFSIQTLYFINKTKQNKIFYNFFNILWKNTKEIINFIFKFKKKILFKNIKIKKKNYSYSKIIKFFSIIFSLNIK